MLHRLSKSPGLFPPCEGVAERVSFNGMQDPNLVVGETHPIWRRVDSLQPTYDQVVGRLEIDTTALPDLLASDHPEASLVANALDRLGIYD